MVWLLLLVVVLVLVLDFPSFFEDEEENENEDDLKTPDSGQALFNCSRLRIRFDSGP